MHLPDKFINWTLISEPMSWAVVFAIASIWLIFFHVVIQGFTAMQGGQTSFGAGAPGQVLAPSAANTGVFSAAGEFFDSRGAAMTKGNTTDGFFWGGGIGVGDGTWVDDIEARYAQDGWIANP